VGTAIATKTTQVSSSSTSYLDFDDLQDDQISDELQAQGARQELAA
jgi:hypothetical protein